MPMSCTSAPPTSRADSRRGAQRRPEQPRRDHAGPDGVLVARRIVPPERVHLVPDWLRKAHLGEHVGGERAEAFGPHHELQRGNLEGLQHRLRHLGLEERLVAASARRPRGYVLQPAQVDDLAARCDHPTVGRHQVPCQDGSGEEKSITPSRAPREGVGPSEGNVISRPRYETVTGVDAASYVSAADSAPPSRRRRPSDSTPSATAPRRRRPPAALVDLRGQLVESDQLSPVEHADQRGEEPQRRPPRRSGRCPTGRACQIRRRERRPVTRALRRSSPRPAARTGSVGSRWAAAFAAAVSSEESCRWGDAGSTGVAGEMSSASNVEVSTSSETLSASGSAAAARLGDCELRRVADPLRKRWPPRHPRPGSPARARPARREDRRWRPRSRRGSASCSGSAATAYAGRSGSVPCPVSRANWASSAFRRKVRTGVQRRIGHVVAARSREQLFARLRRQHRAENLPWSPSAARMRPRHPAPTRLPCRATARPPTAPRRRQPRRVRLPSRERIFAAPTHLRFRLGTAPLHSPGPALACGAGSPRPDPAPPHSWIFRELLRPRCRGSHPSEAASLGASSTAGASSASAGIFRSGPSGIGRGPSSSSVAGVARRPRAGARPPAARRPSSLRPSSGAAPPLPSGATLPAEATPPPLEPPQRPAPPRPIRRRRSPRRATGSSCRADALRACSAPSCMRLAETSPSIVVRGAALARDVFLAGHGVAELRVRRDRLEAEISAVVVGQIDRRDRRRGDRRCRFRRRGFLDLLRRRHRPRGRNRRRRRERRRPRRGDGGGGRMLRLDPSREPGGDGRRGGGAAIRVGAPPCRWPPSFPPAPRSSPGWRRRSPRRKRAAA